MSEMGKKIYFRLSPELSDGFHTSTVDSPEAVIEAVQIWLSEFRGGCAGETFSVETVEMTQEEFDALPEL